MVAKPSFDVVFLVAVGSGSGRSAIGSDRQVCPEADEEELKTLIRRPFWLGKILAVAAKSGGNRLE